MENIAILCNIVRKNSSAHSYKIAKGLRGKTHGCLTGQADFINHSLLDRQKTVGSLPRATGHGSWKLGRKWKACGDGKKKTEKLWKRAKTGRVGGPTYSGKVGLGCNDALLETSTWEVGEEGRDERGRERLGMRLILERGHVFRSQSNTLRERWELEAGTNVCLWIERSQILARQRAGSLPSREIHDMVERTRNSIPCAQLIKYRCTWASYAFIDDPSINPSRYVSHVFRFVFESYLGAILFRDVSSLIINMVRGKYGRTERIKRSCISMESLTRVLTEWDTCTTVYTYVRSWYIGNFLDVGIVEMCRYSRVIILLGLITKSFTRTS